MLLPALLLSATLSAAQSTATLTGTVVDPTGAPVPGAQVVLEQPLRAFVEHTASDADGRFRFANLPFQTYRLLVESPGFAPDVREVAARSPVPLSVRVELALAAHVTEVTVTAGQGTLVDRTETGTRVALSQGAIEQLPTAAGSRGLEAVLVTFPGFAQNANGAIHPRGAHNQMTFVIDGLPVAEQLTGAFANALDTGIVQTVELVTGNVPAEFGSKVSGVAVVTTRSGLATGARVTGELDLGVGQEGLAQTSAHLGGALDRLGYFASAHVLTTDRFLDQVSLDNLHNGGGFARGYARVDATPARRDVVRLHVMGGVSSFDLANLRSQQAAGQDQRQRLGDVSVWGAHLRTLDSSSVLESLAAWRGTEARLFASPGDTPVTASQDRSARTLTLGTRYSRQQGRHSLRAGVDFQHVPLSETFSFGITERGFNAPGADGFNDALVPHDLTRGGTPFVFADSRSGRQLSAFVQDRITLGPVTASLGLRWDDYRLLVRDRAWQPRLGVAWAVGGDLVLRASYNRNFQTPPTENLLLSSSEAAGRLSPPAVREALGRTFRPIPPERQHVYEIGAQQALGSRATLDVSAYVKRSRDQQDNNNFFDTGIIFPTSLAAIDARGLEARLTIPSTAGFSGSLSATTARAVSTPPFTGGLFLGQDAVAALSAGPFRIDHDQALAVHGVLRYHGHRDWWGSLSIRHDSGLVSNPSDPDEVAADPDYADLLPYVNLTGGVPRVRPRTIVDVAGGVDLDAVGLAGFSLQGTVTNLTDRVALYNFQSVFVGTRLVAPRAASLRVRYRW